MKKKLLGIAVIAIVAIGTAWNVSKNKNDVSLINLTLENVEALARGEDGGRGCSVDYSSICETSRNDYTGYRNN